MEILSIAFLTFVASAVGTITGFGTSTIMIPLLVLFLSPVETILLVAIIHWFGNIWKVALFRSGFNLRLILLFGVPGLAASWFGASIALGAKEEILIRFLGAFLACYSFLLMFQPKFKIPAGNAAALSGGALSGFFAGMFGIGGAIRSMFLTVFDLPKAVYIATAGAIGLLIDATRIITFLRGGATLPEGLWYSMPIFILISFAGAYIAKNIVERIPQTHFRTVIAIFLFLIGTKLILLP